MPHPPPKNQLDAAEGRLAGLELLLAWRIVRSKKSRFLSVITVVAITGIAFGVTALVVVLSVTGGFQEAFRERILGLHPHLIVWPRSDSFHDYRQVAERVRAHPHIKGATPTTYDDMMVAHGDRRAGAVVKGIDTRTIGDVVDLRSLIKDGSLDALDETPSASEIAPGRLELRNLLQEVAYTLVLTDSGPTLHMDEPAVPFPDEASLRVLNAGPEAIDLAVASEDPDKGPIAVAAALAPGALSSPVTLPAGRLTLGFVTGGAAQGVETANESAPVLDSGTSALLVVARDGGTTTSRLLPVQSTRPGPEQAAVRVVELRSKPTPVTVVVDDGVIPADGAAHTVPARSPGVVLGQALAARLNASVGDFVTLASSYRGIDSREGPPGLEPTSGRFAVTGVFESGYYDYDKRFALVAFGAATRFLGNGDRAKWLEVAVDDVLEVESRRSEVESLLEPYSLATYTEDLTRVQRRLGALYRGDVSQFEVEPPSSALAVLRNAARGTAFLRSGLPSAFSRDTSWSVISWREVNGPLFEALKLQKLVITIFFIIIIVVAAFNVVGTQIVMVRQKTREIAILKAMGLSARRVRRVFLLQGLLVSLIGVTAGLLAGLGICGGLMAVGWPLEPEVYLIDRLPVSLSGVEVALVALATLVVTLLATTRTAARAGRLHPADGIRWVE